MRNGGATLPAGSRVNPGMNIQLVVHENHTDRFGQYATQSDPHGDFGVLLTLVNVKTFDKDSVGRIEVVFTDGHAVEIPYGEIKRAYDEGV